MYITIERKNEKNFSLSLFYINKHVYIIYITVWRGTKDLDFISLIGSLSI